MGIQKMVSFDTGDNNYAHYEMVQRHGGSGGHDLSTTNTRTGRGAWQIKTSTYYGPSEFYWIVPTPTSTIWAQFAYYASQYPEVGPNYNSSDNYRGGIVTFAEDAAIHMRLGFTPDTQALQVGRQATIITTSTQTNLLPLSTWIFVEVKAVIADAPNGSVLAKVNGITVIDATGLDTRNGGTGVVNRVGIAAAGDITGTTGFMGNLWDDFMFGDGTSPNASPPGDSRIEFLVPSADGDFRKFTPSTGTNWSNVDEVPPSDVDYNYSAEVGDTDVFAMSNLGGNGLIHGIQSLIRVRKDDAGYRLVRPSFYKPIGQGDTSRLYVGASASVSDAYAWTRTIAQVSPDTGEAWTVEELADLQFGYTIGGGNHFSLDGWITGA